MSVSNSVPDEVVDPVQRAKGRRTMVLLFLISAAPVVAALLAFYVWRPASSLDHGELVNPPVAVTLADSLHGKWVMALHAPAGCDDLCARQLYNTRQVRTLQADNMDRVARLWVIDGSGAPDAALLQQHEGLVLSHDPALSALLGDVAQIALIDPRGNLMLRFKPDADPKRMVKDLQKLLKYAR